MKIQFSSRSLKHLAATMITSGLVAGLMIPGLLNSRAEAIESSSIEANETVNPGAFPDGIYLYGESPAAEQIGSAYLVFEVNDSQVIGAYYLPHSSFDCFQGEFTGGNLDLTLINSYDQTAYSYSLPVQTEAFVAEAGNTVITPTGLGRLHPIATISSNDQRILETCKADFQ